MSDKNLKEQLYDAYDKVVYIATLNVFSKAKEYGKGVISLSELDPNNKDHLFLHYVAKTYADAGVFRYYLPHDYTLFQAIRFNLTVNRKGKWLHRSPYTEDVINTNEFLDFTYQAFPEEIEGDDYASIYEAFWR